MVNEVRIGFDRINVNFGGNSVGNTLEPDQSGILNALANVTHRRVRGFWSGHKLASGQAGEYLAGAGQLELRQGET